MKAMIRPRGFLSTYEAGRKYNLSQGYLRHLIAKGALKAESVKVSDKHKIWLIDEASLRRFTKKKRPLGRPKKSR